MHDFGLFIDPEPQLILDPMNSPIIQGVRPAYRPDEQIDPLEAKIIWLHASGKQWKDVADIAGLARSNTYNHWRHGMYVVGWIIQGLEWKGSQ